MPRRFSLLLCPAIAFAMLATLSCSKEVDKAPAQTSPSSVWRVEKNGKHIYVGGTIHLLREKDHPLPKVFDQAYADSTSLLFELPPDADQDGAIMARMREMGSYGQNGDLSSHVSPETLRQVHEWSDANGHARATVDKLRPWYLALIVSATEYGKMGANPKHGVDAHFEELAKENKKPAAGLETIEFQLGIFSNLNDKLQEELLLQTFSEAQTAAKDFEELIVAWKSGDMPKLQEFLFRDADKYPELMEDFLFKRNHAWIPPLLKHLEKGETVFVLVGAGHLGGEQGLLSLLKKEGCTITQLGVADVKNAKGRSA
ncbi:MAG: TraB/GumN family protein [Roseimicrobium sp.]